MYILKINFLKDLLDSYEAIINWPYARNFEKFYTDGNNVSTVWLVVKDNFKDPRFESLKISKYWFQCYFGLWSATYEYKATIHHLPSNSSTGATCPTTYLWQFGILLRAAEASS